MGEAGAQWLFPSESGVHRRGVESEACAGESVLSARCKLLLVDGGPLFEGKKLYQFDGGEQTANTCVAVA